MSFISFEFAIFFVVVLLLRSGLRTSSADKWLLLLASIAFYMSWSVPCVLLIMFTSLLDFSIARQISRTADPQRRTRLLMASLVISLGR